jgi:chromosome segregation ATPase
LGTLDSARRLIQRVFDRETEVDVEEPRAPLPAEPAPGAEFADLQSLLGAEPSAVEPIHLRDMEVAELRTMLTRLQPMGDELARMERTRVGLERRCAELEESLTAVTAELEESRLAKEPDATKRELRLQRRLEEREGVLARERERLAEARRKRDERNKVASDRWREIHALRAHLRRVEQNRG